MENSILFMILLQMILILLNAVFACAEIAVISMNDTKLARMAEDGDKRAVRLTKLTAQPARFLATIQVAITLSGFLGSAFAAENFSDILVNWLVELGVTVPARVLDSVAVVLITIILSYFTLVFGELVPKQIAMRKSEALALGLSGIISAIAVAFAPLVSLLTVSTNALLRLLGFDVNEEEEGVSEEEIRMMVDAGSEKGTIEHEEKEFIQNVFEFNDLSAGEIFTHRTDVELLDINASMEEWQDIIFNSRHTRYPVCDGTADKVIGILNAKEYFRTDQTDKEAVMENAVKVPYFVPETVKADVLFRNMRREHHAIAIVLDEYGGMSGIITLNDLVELLVGDLNDDVSEDEELIRQMSENTWEISGTAELEDVSEALGVALEDDEVDTFNGFVLSELGTIPEDGEVVDLEVGGLYIKAAKIINHQVDKAQVFVSAAES